MVSTRHHPQNFPPPDLTPTKASPSKSPSKRTTRASTAIKEDSPDESMAVARPRSASIATTWSHTPSQFTLLWMLISLPLVIWDTVYMLGRPHTMPGGKWHWPLWVPYKLYGTVDYVYGFPAFEAGDGWPPAQGFCNAIETAMYLAYVGLAFYHGKEEKAVGRGAPTDKLSFGRRKVVGREAAVLVLLAFTTALMTFYKTVLYWMIEYFSGFHSIGHNDAFSLIVYWIIPNGAWFVGSGYVMYVSGSEILQGLEMAAGLPHKKYL